MSESIGILIVALLGFVVLGQALIIRQLIQSSGGDRQALVIRQLIQGADCPEYTAPECTQCDKWIESMDQIRGEIGRLAEAKAHRHLIGG